MDGHIHLYGPIGEFRDEKGELITGIRLIDVVTEAQSQRDKTRFIVHFNGPGGNTNEAELIASFLTRLQERTEVIALGEGLVASALSKIFLSIDKRAALPAFEFMAHNPWGGVQGDAGFIEAYAEDMRRLEKDYEKFYSERLNIDEDTLSNLMDQEVYLDIERSKTLGIINFELTETPAIIMMAVNKSDNNEKSKTMDAETKTFLQELKDDIKALFTKKDEPKAITLESKEGVVIEFPNEAPAVGDRVGVEDGTYTIIYDEREWSLTVVEGVVSELTELVPEEVDDVEALKAENEALKKQVQEIQAQATETAEIKKEVQEMRAYIAKHKAAKSTEEPTTEGGEKFRKHDAPVKSETAAYLEQKRADAAEKRKKFHKR